MPASPREPHWPSALADLVAHKASTALMFDVDGTLAAIAERPEDVSVTGETTTELERLVGEYLLVAAVTGRPAAQARSIVGADITYVGLHGIERLGPGAAEPEVEPSALEWGATIRAVSDAHASAIADAGIRIEDKNPITALHWRGVEDEDRAAKVASEVAKAAVAAGAAVKPGRKVLEIRPDTGVDKGSAVASLLAESGADRALYAGDDTTDVDAFRMLGQMRVDRKLRRVVRVAVASAEEPPDLRSRADVVVEGTAEIARLLARL